MSTDAAPVKLKRTLFREYDLRGRVPEYFDDAADELSDAGMHALGRAFGTLAAQRGLDKVVVGHDLRTYSERLRDHFVAGLVDSGMHVYDIGYALSPTLYFATLHLDCPAGVMITASHNPQGWSGLKMSLNYVQTMLKPDIEALREICDTGAFASGEGSAEKVDIREAYIKDMVDRVNISRPLKIVLDPGNGTAAMFCVETFERAGVEVIPLFCDPDPTFPNHFPNPSEMSAREAIRAKVKETGADLGFSFDGDGDRLGVQDKHGNDVNADLLLMLLARPVLERHPGAPIVFDVKCSQALVEDIEAHGGKPVMWKTGHSWIKAKIKETGAPIGGERSGHLFIKDGFHGYDDGLFAGLRMAEYLASQEKDLTTLLAEAPQYVTSPEIHIDCADEVKYEVMERVLAQMKDEFGDRVNDTNGARVTFDDGWGLVRPSSNLPELVLVFEGKTQEQMERIKTLFRERLAAYPEIGSVWHNE
ncbi:MAG: phosphomannomutase/phosphoglucomutase [Planctomycetota bacterium]|nr:phosphomannomutase/phosphoglucomutase [Planctomycetota bacterium]